MALSYPKPIEVEVLDSGAQAPTPNHTSSLCDWDGDCNGAVLSAADRGSKCYIDTLSDDILLEIVFSLFHDDSKSHCAHRTIMAVSRKWRQLVTMNPLCWNYVEIGSNIYQTTTSPFLLSGPIQLVDVTMDFRAMMVNGITMEDACTVMMKHHTQIRSLEVLNLSHWSKLATFLEIWNRNGTTTPNLKALSISSESRDLNPESISPDVFPPHNHHWPGAAYVESLTLFFFNPFVLPTMKNLTFLELSTVGAPINILGHIFRASPLVETLVLHQYEIDDYRDDSSLHPIIAQSLRYLGVGSIREIFLDEPPPDDFSRLSAPDLEGMDILQGRWSTTRFQHLEKYPKLRRFRIHDFDFGDLDFLASLPATVTLEIVQMPKANFYIQQILYLANLECIIWTFEDQMYGFKVRTSFQDIWDMVRVIKAEVKSPTIMDIPPGEEPPSDVLAILGNQFTARTSSKWEPWLLKHDSLNYALDRNSESFDSS